MTRVFISHKQDDSELARRIQIKLEYGYSIDSYLDLLDPHIAQNGDDLGEHFRQQIGKCTHLLAVISSVTSESWWVPFEIGIATEKSYPLASYISGVAVGVPEYLQKWPYLRSLSDVDQFAQQIRRSENRTHVRSLDEAPIANRMRYARDFHAGLKSALGQR